MVIRLRSPPSRRQLVSRLDDGRRTSPSAQGLRARPPTATRGLSTFTRQLLSFLVRHVEFGTSPTCIGERDSNLRALPLRDFVTRTGPKRKRSYVPSEPPVCMERLLGRSPTAAGAQRSPLCRPTPRGGRARTVATCVAQGRDWQRSSCIWPITSSVSKTVRGGFVPREFKSLPLRSLSRIPRDPVGFGLGRFASSARLHDSSSDWPASGAAVSGARPPRACAFGHVAAHRSVTAGTNTRGSRASPWQVAAVVEKKNKPRRPFKADDQVEGGKSLSRRTARRLVSEV